MIFASSILEGAAVALIYLPFLFILYKVCFNKFDQHRIKQCAKMIEATVMESNVSANENMSAEQYYINKCDYYYKYKRYFYTFNTYEAMKVGSIVKLYYISNPAKAVAYKNVGSDDFIPWVKLYALSFICASVICIIVNSYKHLNNRLFNIIIISIIALYIAYIVMHGLFYLCNLFIRLKYGDLVERHISKVEAECIYPDDNNMTDELKVYKYKYTFDGKERIYKEKARGKQPKKISLYFLEKPKFLYKSKDMILSSERFNWSIWLMICWFISTFLLCIIFIH